jgi:hypothetical protein
MIEQVLPRLARDIHADNVRNGCYLDERGITVEAHDRDAMLLQGICDLSEACDGFDGTPDTRLPQYTLYQVEVANFVIHVLGLIGYEAAHGHTMPTFLPTSEFAYLQGMPRSTSTLGLMRLVCTAAERCHARNFEFYVQALAECVSVCYALANHQGFVLSGVINDLRAYRVRIVNPAPTLN